MQLSEIARQQLRLRMIKQFLNVRMCSQCNTPAGQAPPRKQHPVQEELAKAENLLDGNPSSYDLARTVHKLRSKLHHTSRCCGAPYVTREVDNQQAFYETWVNRYSQKINIDQLRDERSDSAGCDDDFLLMQFLWGISDVETRYLIRICRDEDQRQGIMSIPEDDYIAPPPEPGASGRKMLGADQLIALADKARPR